MATAAHRPGEEGASRPRIVDAPTLGGLVLTDRFCWGVLGAAMAASAALILWLNRGTTFFIDEVVWLERSPDLSLSGVFDPHNGHLIATSRVLYKAILETFGAEYVAFRVLGVIGVLLVAALIFTLVKRRVGAVAALAPTIVLLFFGSAWSHLVIPVGFTETFSTAAGLGALVALERRSKGGDAATCALLSLSIATYSVGLAFIAGVAISVIIRPDRARRAWIFLIPLALYITWWLWKSPAPGFSGEGIRLVNVLLIPAYSFESLAAVTGALTGLNYDFASDSPDAHELGWGRVLAVAAVVALVLRIRRGNAPASLWASLAIVLAFWSLGALVFDSFSRLPGATRFLYPGAVMVLLVATDASRSIRFSRVALGVLFAAAAVSLATNLTLLRDGAATYRNDYSGRLRAQFTTLDLARGHVDAGFDAAQAGGLSPWATRVAAGSYYKVVDAYGSPAFSVDELADQSDEVRDVADRILVSALGVGLEPAPAREPARGCRQFRADPASGAIGIELPPGGASLRAHGDAQAAVTLRRFGTTASGKVGSLTPEETATLRIPADSAATPWSASVAGARSVTVCALP